VLDAVVEVVLALRIRVERFERLDALRARHVCPKRDHVLLVLPDVPEVADPDPNAAAAMAQEPREEVRLEDAGAEDPLLGRPLDVQRAGRRLCECAQDRVEARRPDAWQLASDAEVREQVVVDRLHSRDRRDRARIVGQLVEHRREPPRLGEATEHRTSTLSW
jgi:hypothetical protein